MKKTAIELGFDFEDITYQKLCEAFPNFTIRREKEIIRTYGQDISAIDIEMFNESIHKYIFIQCKWKNSQTSCQHTNHFIQCCNQVAKIRNLPNDGIHHYYVTKIPLGKPSILALNRISGENIYDSDMGFCINKLIQKINSNIQNIQIKEETKYVIKPENKPVIAPSDDIPALINIYSDEFKPLNNSNLLQYWTFTDYENSFQFANQIKNELIKKYPMYGNIFEKLFSKNVFVTNISKNIRTKKIIGCEIHIN